MKTGKGIIILNGKRISDPADVEELKLGDVVSFGSTPVINPERKMNRFDAFVDLLDSIRGPSQAQRERLVEMWRENDASWDAYMADMLCQQWAGISAHIRETGQMPPLGVDSPEGEGVRGGDGQQEHVNTSGTPSGGERAPNPVSGAATDCVPMDQYGVCFEHDWVHATGRSVWVCRQCKAERPKS